MLSWFTHSHSKDSGDISKKDKKEKKEKKEKNKEKNKDNENDKEKDLEHNKENESDANADSEKDKEKDSEKNTSDSQKKLVSSESSQKKKTGSSHTRSTSSSETSKNDTSADAQLVDFDEEPLEDDAEVQAANSSSQASSSAPDMNPLSTSSGATTPTSSSQSSGKHSYIHNLKSSLAGMLGFEKMEVTESEKTLQRTQMQSSSTADQRANLWSQVSKFIGTDPVSMISLPVWIFEPTSFLQRMAEPLSFGSFLDMVAISEDPVERLQWLAAFNCAILTNTERTGKPFNPILGETFEYISKEKGYKFLAEQVSHHPPIGVAETHTDSWILKQEAHVKTKFHGNYIEIFAVGTTHFILKETGEHYYWRQPNSCVHNIFVGGIWVEHWGDINIKTTLSNHVCHLKYHKSGWLGFGEQHKVSGEIMDGKTVQLELVGKWSSFLSARKPSATKVKEKEFYLWQRAEEKIENKWGMPNFTCEELDAIHCDEEYEKTLPPTDSRLRPDRKALSKQDMDLASKEKHRMEELQRKERRDRQAAQLNWTPRHFKKVDHPIDGYIWEYLGNYWENKPK